MILVVLAALGLQQPPLEAERARIRDKAPLTSAERDAFSFPPAAKSKSRASYSLAVLPLEFADVKHGTADFKKLFFGRVAKYYADASGGAFTLSGRVFEPIGAGAKRADFRDRDFLLAMAAFLAREGDGALATFDGVAFVAAGALGKRGDPLWPHGGRVRAGDRSVDYVQVVEKARGREVGIAAHELMHLLGFSDKYDDEKARVGAWCIMGTGYASETPAPPCAECRERLGWTKTAVVDPGKDGRYVLGPGGTRSLKVRINPDGSELLHLEFRDRLFIWHVGGGQKIELVGRFPSGTADRLTPLSKPSFRGRTVGARPVWITDIRVEDGRAWFRVGPKASLTPLEAWRRARIGKRLGE